YPQTEKGWSLRRYHCHTRVHPHHRKPARTIPLSESNQKDKLILQSPVSKLISFTPYLYQSRFQTQIHIVYGMRECTHRYVIYSGMCICANRIQRDATRSSCYHFSLHQISTFTDIFRSKIVKHDSIYSFAMEQSIQFFKVTYFYFNGNIYVFRFFVVKGIAYCVCNTSSIIHMIVFNQYHIIETEAVICTSADHYGTFF